MKKILFALGMFVFVVSALPQARADEISLDFIYDNLSGGNWIDAEGYGYGWQPDAATSDPNWRPYSDGYWAYTDYGWTWISYEDFGWATYHYGRWANLSDYGWVWFPGSDLDWGPAWVSWRTGGDYIGWAPLPPRGPNVVYEGQPIGASVDVQYDIGPQYYNFCDVRFIGEPVLRDRIFPPAQNVTYITSTVNVTNIYVQNNVVYNYGPNFNVVNSYSSRPIQRLSIERQTTTDLSTAVKSGALTKVQGNKLLVAAPTRIAKAPPSAKPPAVKAKVAQPKVEHGWSGVPDRAAVEQKIKNQNPKNIPPPTRPATRPVESAAPGGPNTPPETGGKTAVSPVPRGRPGRPGASVSPEAGLGTPAERGKPTPPARGRPLATPPGQRPGISATPFERARPTPAARPGARVSATPARGREGLAPTPFEREERTGRPGASTAPALRASPPEERRNRPPVRRPGESPVPGTTGERENIPPQERSRGPEPERQRFGTPAPMGAGANERRSAEERTPPNVRRPDVTSPNNAAGGERPGAPERRPGAVNEPGGVPPRGKAPESAERGAPPQQERGKRPERGTPPPRP